MVINHSLAINKAYNYLNSLEHFGIKLGLERINKACSILNNPQMYYPSILITGTNGKGSTSAFVSSVLQSASYKVGLFTSPHLIDATERIQINREKIHPLRFASIINKIKKIDEKNDINLTYFEFMTCVSFQYFKEENIDVGVFEVGLGGKYDATNILNPLMSCLTYIDYDHTDYLGNTLIKITQEKAGIIKNNGCFIHSERRPYLKKLLKEICLKANSKYIDALKNTKIVFNFSYPYFNVSFTTHYNSYPNIKIPLLGYHQIQNALLSIRISEELNNFNFNISESHIKEGIENTRWECRLEPIQENPLVLFDSAHNIDGVKSAFNYVNNIKRKNLICVFGVLKDKLWKKMVQIVDLNSDDIIFTEPISERALPCYSYTALNLKTPYEIIRDPIEAYKKALSKANSESIVLVLGSMYLVGHIKRYGMSKV